MFDPDAAVALLGQEPHKLTRAEIDERLGLAEGMRSWTSGREARLLRALADLEKDPSDPAKDTADRLNRRQNCGPGKAKRRTETATQLGQLPQTQSALENGTITDEHGEAIAHARAKADASARAALDAHEAELLAAGSGETAFEFRRRLDRFVKRHSDDDGRSEWERMKAKNRLRCWKNRQGMTQIAGELDPEWGAIVTSELNRRADELFRRHHQDHPDDQAVPAEERTNEHRLAEALVETCRRAEGHEHPASTHDRVICTLTLADLFGQDHDGPGPTINDGTPVPASVARRMACDAGIIPLVLGGESIPLDLGRARRIATPGQRLALGALWSTCSFADCRRPFDWCEIHHVKPFHADGGHGKTDLTELTPVCRPCHDLSPTPGWRFDKLADGSTITRAPDGTQWRRRPDRPDRKHRPAEPPPAAAPEPGPNPEPAATLFSHAA
ncbi:MAG TPA: DUF222 domain-containing protein [Acidimicrobiales bacterium]